MKKILAVVALAALVVSLPSLGGERVVCKIWLDDAGIVARSTAPTPTDLITTRPDTAGLGYSTLDGYACPTIKLQPDGGIVHWDAGTTFAMTLANGSAADGGVAGCPLCDFRGATSVVLQCKAPVYYSEKWDGGVDKWGQRGVTPATSDDTYIDFDDENPDGYQINFRGAVTGQNQHISVKPVTASDTNFCTISTTKRTYPPR